MDEMRSKIPKRVASSASSSAGSSASAQSHQDATSTSSEIQFSVTTPTTMKLTRNQEKNTLALLNDRLVAYIERNRKLEKENASVNKQRMTWNNYDRMMLDAERLIESGKKRIRLELESVRLREELKGVKEKLEKKTKEAADANRSLVELDARLQDLTKLESERGQGTEKVKGLENKVARLTREVEILKTELEKEKLATTSLDGWFKHELEELRSSSQRRDRGRGDNGVETLEESLQKSEHKLQQMSLQDLRAECKEQLQGNKIELNSLYAKEIADFKSQVERLQSSSAAKDEVLKSLSAKCDKLTAQIGIVQSERNSLLNKITGLEKKIEKDHQLFVNMLQERDDDIERLVGEKSALMSEYQAVMDTKVQLDMEIATYRKLLEGGERRFGKTSSRVAKRQRNEEATTEAAAEFDSEAISHGDLEISEEDPEGRFIRLRNKSEKEVSLSKWELTRDTRETTTTYKFSPQAKVAAHSAVTIWSSGSGAQESPANIVMEGHFWPISEHFRTFLVNSSEELQAIRETTLRQRKRLGFSQPGELVQQEEPDGKGCGVA